MPKNNYSRRRFLGYAGAASGLVVLAAGCNKDEVVSNGTLDGVDLGTGDIGILNYAYALEQLEAAFYTQVGMSLMRLVYLRRYIPKSFIF